MSVVSEKSNRRFMSSHHHHHHQSNRNPNTSGSVYGSSRSAVEMEHQSSFLLPRFSAAASEGAVKLDFDNSEDNWAENTTVVTGATSEHSYSGGVSDRFEAEAGGANAHGRAARAALSRRCSRWCWTIFAFLLSVTSLLSAPLMAAIPFALGNWPTAAAWLMALMPSGDDSGTTIQPARPQQLSNNGMAVSGVQDEAAYEWPPMHCDVDCQGALLNMGGKTALLLLAFYVLYWRRAVSDLPRLQLQRAAFSAFTLFVQFAFWLFYVVRIVLERNANFLYVVQYALSLLDLLLFIHCVWIFFELRRMRPAYAVTVVRDPDGESHTHQLGQMSIQEAAVHVLRLYHTHFSTYNARLAAVRQAAAFCGGGGVSGYRSGGRFGGTGSGFPPGGGFKLYDIDGRGAGDAESGGATISEASVRMLVEASARRRMAGHNNDLLYAELEFEKRLKKRKYRLIGCAEEVFAHVQAVNVNNANRRVEPMDPSTAAKAVLGGLSRPLTRYLRFTRQQFWHSPQQTTAYLERCLAYQFSARAFLQRFFADRLPPSSSPPLSSMSAQVDAEAAGGGVGRVMTAAALESKWSILCDWQPSGPLRNGVSFVLRSHNSSADPDAGVQLHCTFAAFPFYNLTEQRLPGKSTRFELKITQ